MSHGHHGHCHNKQQIRIRREAPSFEAQGVENGEFKTIKLEQYRGKYVYLFFYPLDFTFVCPTEIIAFSNAIEEFKKLNVQVIGCSVDSPFTHLAWVNTARKEGGLGGINFPLISDLSHSISKDYGVYIEEDGHTIRGSFIIDDKGIVKQITMNDNPVGRSVEEALRLIKGFQYTDVHGEVCPAGWNPETGNVKTMKPDPKGSKSYFAEVNK
ncbi:peroxiredoxin [Tieghemostelium lacteum]|uniref:thioredoxin-dependent peroxiredoxin n=1 Tax=Tieghemostelium lacteum TaxID=361077 RepID=A0A151ZGA4_TIELA|nr:peroxiredoxin [Tieghemostelium lacteum]|eukprot:KYQ92894.1 peroxiredoxin [Tieghemostelium lacteum]